MALVCLQSPASSVVWAQKLHFHPGSPGGTARIELFIRITAVKPNSVQHRARQALVLSSTHPCVHYRAPNLTLRLFWAKADGKSEDDGKVYRALAPISPLPKLLSFSIQLSPLPVLSSSCHLNPFLASIFLLLHFLGGQLDGKLKDMRN